MGIILKVTTEKLMNTASDIENQLKDVDAQLKQIGQDIRRTRGFWEGDASDTHMKQYEALEPEIQEIIAKLQKRPSELLKMAELYSETETQAKEAAMSLVADVIV